MFNWLKIGIPKRILIKREVDFHTHYIGRVDDGRQFFGYFTSTIPDNSQNTVDIKAEIKHYVVLYIFDKKGNYITTKYCYAGTTIERNDSVEIKKLEELISELGGVTYMDIKIKPFQTIIDGYVFGLIAYKEFNTLDLEPNSTISFKWPWNGLYDT